jgi:hypothetical protein
MEVLVMRAFRKFRLTAGCVAAMMLALGVVSVTPQKSEAVLQTALGTASILIGGPGGTGSQCGTEYHRVTGVPLGCGPRLARPCAPRFGGLKTSFCAVVPTGGACTCP